MSVDLVLVRRKADEVVTLARKDESFAKQMTENPEEALSSIGFPDWAIGHATEEMRYTTSEVSGYMPCRWTCDPITCIWTSCTFLSGI